MSKAILLKLNDNIFSETETVVKQIDTKRNMYINIAVAYYNRLMKRKLLKDKYLKESKLVSKESIKVLHEFEASEDEIYGL